MFESIFLLQILLSFLIGGGYVAFVTLVAEKHGSKWGGLLGGFPVTTSVGLFFIGWVNGLEAVVEAVRPGPFLQLIYALFLFVFAYLSSRNFAFGLLAALVVWFVMVCFLLFQQPLGFLLSLFLVLLLGTVLTLLFFRGMQFKDREQSQILFSRAQFLVRVFLSGLVVSLAVFLSKVANPVVGGVVALFPVVTISTLCVLNYSSGLEFARAITKSMFVSSFVNFIPFLTSVYFSFQYLDPIPATLITLVICIFSAFFSLSVVRKLL